MEQTRTDQTLYEKRGVSSSKLEVHAATKNLDKGLFPGAFCTIQPDIFTNDPDHCLIQHADGAGTKSSLAYLVWKLNRNLGVWKGIIRDSLFMNLDDAACVGALGPFLVSLTIGRNKALIPGEVIKTLIEECQEVCSFLTHYGIPCLFSGGETADIGDLVRTIVVDNTITTRMRRDRVIDASRIGPGAIIVGFSTTGQAPWEISPNSGMGSNGLTNARHDLIHRGYREHTETFSPETPADLIYCGQYALGEALPGDSDFTIASALLSPTRTYLPLIYRLLDRVKRDDILGLIHCSGGGQTKIGKFGMPGITYVKDTPFPVPPLFQMLQSERKLSWREMYQTYNMGHRLEAVVRNREIADLCIGIAENINIEARIIGYTCEGYEDDDGTSGIRRVVIQTPDGRQIYDFDAVS